jgi:hypothetical protein
LVGQEAVPLLPIDEELRARIEERGQPFEGALLLRDLLL